jgi:N utilization substance protein B
MPRIKKQRAGREVAFQALYGLSFAPVSSNEELRRAFLHSLGASGKNKLGEFEELTGFAWDLVEGVWNASSELDAAISRYSHNWRVDRMGRVELVLLRLAVFEMLFRQDVSSRTAIREAFELSRQFGADDAKKFINGILDAMAKAVECGELTRIAVPGCNS